MSAPGAMSAHRGPLGLSAYRGPLGLCQPSRAKAQAPDSLTHMHPAKHSALGHFMTDYNSTLIIYPTDRSVQ